MRKEYVLSTMTFNDLGDLIRRYVRGQGKRTTLLAMRDEIFVVTTIVEEVNGSSPKYQVSFSNDHDVESQVFSITINNDYGSVLLEYIGVEYIGNDDGKLDTCSAACNDICTGDLRCFDHAYCKFDNTKLLEEYLHELVRDKVDRYNDNVKYAMIFTVMISVLGYCTMKVVRYIRADKIDRRAMLKSTLVPACILAGFTATTNTFRSMLVVIAKVVKMINQMITKVISVMKKG